MEAVTCWIGFPGSRWPPGLREYIEAGKDKEGKGFDPRKLLAPGFAACVDMVKYKIDVFGSTNKA